jgi:hypothetical protein
LILLYVDESGNHEAADQHFVVGGVAVHEADLEALRGQVQALMSAHIVAPHLQGLELHATAMRTGKGSWRSVPRTVRESLLRDIAGLLGSFTPPSGNRYALFAVVREQGAVPYADPVERTFEELYLRFNGFLQRRAPGGAQYFGLVVADEAKYEKVLQPMVTQWRELGTRIGRVRQVVEVPLFVDSRATRLLQLADFVAHAVYLLYERDQSDLVELMQGAFDTTGGALHGLVHLTPYHLRCRCRACSTRRP